MNITNVLLDIEEEVSLTRRVILYAELIIHLKSVKSVIYFQESGIAWKNAINEQIVNDVHKIIDSQIIEIMLLIESCTKDKTN